MKERHRELERELHQLQIRLSTLSNEDHPRRRAIVERIEEAQAELNVLKARRRFEFTDPTTLTRDQLVAICNLLGVEVKAADTKADLSGKISTRLGL
jgi:hypothetical protein